MKTLTQQQNHSIENIAAAAEVLFNQDQLTQNTTLKSSLVAFFVSLSCKIDD